MQNRKKIGKSVFSAWKRYLKPHIVTKKLPAKYITRSDDASSPPFASFSFTASCRKSSSKSATTFGAASDHEKKKGTCYKLRQVIFYLVVHIE